jgi:type IV secretion system protein VirB8
VWRVASEQEIIEEELVYGALRRERLWQRLGLTGLVFGIIGCLSAAAVAVLDVDPPPVVVPYDPATGFALPEASVGASSVTANQAIIEAEVFRYVTDREVYNQLDAYSTTCGHLFHAHVASHSMTCGHTREVICEAVSS